MMPYVKETVPLSRRQLLRLGAAVIPTAVLPSVILSEVSGVTTLMILVGNDESGTDPNLLRSVLTEFLTRGIPVTVTLDAMSLQSGPFHDLNTLMDEFAAREGGLIELAAPLSDVAGQHRYFQMRAAGTLRDTLDAGLGADTARQVATLVDHVTEDGVDLPAFRSAGFRILLRPGAGGDFAADFVGRGQLRVSGGTALPLSGDPARVTDALDKILRDQRDGLLSISLAGLDASAAGAEAVRTLAAGVADRLAAAVLAGSLYLTRPTDYLLQFGPPHLTEVALLLSSPEPGPEDSAVQAFAAMLTASGLSFSLVFDTRPLWLPADAGRVVSWPGPAGSGIPMREPHPLAILLTEPISDHNLPPVSVVLHAEATRTGPTALRADGRLHIAVDDWTTLSARGWPARDSIAVLIRPGDIATPVERSALLRKLVASSEDGQSRFLTLDTLSDQLLAPEPVYVRLWSTLHRQVTDPPLPVRLFSGERTRLREDARVAWTFIDRFTSPTTGLCAGTVQDGPAQRINSEATFWDMASQMQGIVAAARLGLISRDDARDRLALMVVHLPAIALDGHTLPPATFQTGGDDGLVRRSFDICDTGRFLVALDLAVGSGLLAEESASALVGSWDLSAAVFEGRPYNHDGHGWRDTAMSHCTPYIAPAFGDIGLPLDSPYPALSGAATADARMALLYGVAAMGSYGTEPLLLQAIERGSTPESAFLADVLFDAQLSWFETTGQLKCVSEVPLNVAPWFTYQGFRVDRLGSEAWTILSSQALDVFQTQEFQKRIELLSAKSAYLWAAVHPHPYCNRLLRVIREKARIDGFGFSVGVYTATLKPMENYSDLNTNGVILAAIAEMLRDEEPAK